MENTQLSLFGKMYPEHSAATGGRTSAACLKNSRKLSGGAFLSLNLQAENGLLPERSWETVSVSHGAYSTRNIGEYPSVARESTLWQILQMNAPEAYYLSAKACQGILNRAKRRGKQLPAMLEEALNEVVNLAGGYSLHQIIPIHDKATRFNGGGPTRNNDGAGNSLGVGKPGSPSPTLSTCDRHAVVYEPKHEAWSISAKQQSLACDNGVAATIGANDYKEPQVVVGVFMGGQGAKAGSIGYSEDKAPTLRASNSGSNQVPDVVCAAYDTTQITSPLNYSNPKNGDPCHPLAAQQHPPLAVYGVDCRNGTLDEGKTATLQAHVNGGYSLNSTHPVLYPSEGANEDL